jgi:hypothetical protein
MIHDDLESPGWLSRFLDFLPRSRGRGSREQQAPLPGGWWSEAKRIRRQGPGCGCVFFGFCFLMGCAALVMLVWGFILPDWKANNRYLPNTCVVLDRRLATSMSDPGPEGGIPRPVYLPEIKIQYEVARRKYEVWTYKAIGMYEPDRAAQQAIVDSFQVGAIYPCWYDPDRPEKAILVRGHTLAPYVLLLVPIVFLLMGGVGIRHAWKNRGSPVYQRALERTLTAGGALVATDPDQPTVPVLDLSHSPGSTLSYRLPTSTRPGRGLLGCLFFTLLWNGITAPFVVKVMATHLGWDRMEGISKWLVSFGIIPFVLVGLFLIGLLITIAFRALLIALGVGATAVEVSAHPLVPGGRCDLWLSQSGRRTLHMNSLSVLCLCEEEAKGGQGEDRRTTTRRVFAETVVAQEGFEVQPGFPFEVRGELRIPPGAMHSFLTAHNQVRWKLVVRGDVAGWPDFEREFPIIVQPSKGPPE